MANERIIQQSDFCVNRKVWSFGTWCQGCNRHTSSPHIKQTHTTSVVCDSAFKICLFFRRKQGRTVCNHVFSPLMDRDFSLPFPHCFKFLCFGSGQNDFIKWTVHGWIAFLASLFHTENSFCKIRKFLYVGCDKVVDFYFFLCFLMVSSTGTGANSLIMAVVCGCVL